MKSIFNKRLLDILEIFYENSDYLTSRYLSKDIGVTTRTIRNDIKELDELLLSHGARIQSTKGVGYRLIVTDEDKFSEYYKTICNDSYKQKYNVPTFPDERIEYIIKKLLKTNDSITLEDLCDELYISNSTIKKDLKQVKKILQSYRLAVVSRLNKGIRIEGSEIDKRFCMANYFINRSELDKIDLAEFYVDNSRIFNEVDLLKIEEILIKEFKKTNFRLTDVALKNLIIHIAIAIKRIKEENYITHSDDKLKELKNDEEFDIAINIVNTLEKTFNISIPEAEIYYVTIHLLGSKLLGDKRGLKIVKFIETDIKSLIKKILLEVETKLSLSLLEDNTLMCGLALHLKPTFHRIQFNMNLRNPWLDEIKTKYPVAFQAGVIAAQVIEKETGCKINENEIGYLAMHFGASIERMKRKEGNKKKIAIICSSGMGSAYLLLAKLKNSLDNKFDLIGAYPLHQLDIVMSTGPDVILTTIPIKEVLPIPVILVNAVLEDGDLKEIEDKIKSVDDSINKEINFEDLFKEELFFTGIRFDNKQQVISYLTDHMQKQGFITKDIQNSILDRETISSTAIGNLVAIPHPLEVIEVPSCVCVGILEKPILWDKEKKVQLVMVLLISKNMSNRFADMFGTLYQVTKSPISVDKLIQQREFEAFHNQFISEKEKI